MIKISSAIFKTFFLSLCIVANTHFAFGQTASILPPGYTQYLDSNGKPLSAGKVYNYIPSTTTPKTTWQDAGETIPNANPVILDAGGRAKILGDGSYRQIVKDRNNVTIWDAVTSSTGSGSSSPTATGDGDLVGTIKPWAGMTAPNQYAFTYGQEISRTTYSILYTAITSTQAVFCSSGSPTLTGLSDTTNFWIGMAVEVSCVLTGASTIISKTSNSVTLAVNANVSTNTNATFFPWGRGNGSTTFNLPDLRGIVPAGNNNMGGVASSNLNTTYFGATNPNSVGALGGSQSNTLIAINIPGHSHPVFLTDTGHAHAGSTISLQGASMPPNISSSVMPGRNDSGINVVSTPLVIASAVTGITVRDSPSGGGTANQTNYTGGGIAASAVIGAVGSGYTPGSQTITVSGGTCTTQPQFTVTISGGGAFSGTPALLTAGSCTVAPANPAATSGGGGTGGTLNVVYSAQPFSLIPPTRTTNYIIKITPDANSATASGVTSLGGMTGSISCGVNLLCTGNSVSVVGVGLLNSNNIWNGNNYFGNLSPWCDVKAKGALGDGSTDDTSAFNACITAIAALGSVWSGTIYIPPSANPYCIKTGPLAITGSTTAGAIKLLGGGRLNSVISACGTNPTPGLININASYITLENLTVVGYGMTAVTDDPFTTTPNPAIYTGVNCTSCLIDRVNVFGGSHSVFIQAYDVKLRDIVAQYAYGQGAVAPNRSSIIYSINSGYWLDRVKADQVWPVSTPAYGTTISAWTNAHAYALGDVAIITQGGVPYYVQASVAGTSGASAPALKIYNQTITDGVGTLRWLLVGPTTYYGWQIDTGTFEATANQLDTSGAFTNGIAITNTFGGTGPQEIKINDSIAGQTLNGSILASSGGGLNIKGYESGYCVLTGCSGQNYAAGFAGPAVTLGLLQFGGSGYGAFISSGSDIKINSSQIYGSQINAISVAANLNALNLSGNTFPLANPPSGYTINVAGINIAAGTGDYLEITGSICRSATCVVNGATGTNNRIELAQGALSIVNGGTGQRTKATAFDALSPMTTAGDIIYGGVSGTGTRLPTGTSTQVLHGGAVPSWASVTPSDMGSLGTGVATALGVNVGSAGSFVVNGGALGTPSSGVGTNITNVNAATLSGATFAAPGAIGGSTPAEGTFTTLSATTSPFIVGAGGTGSTLVRTIINAGSAAGGGPYIEFNKNSVNKWQFGTVSIQGGAGDDFIFYGAGQSVNAMTIASTDSTVSFGSGIKFSTKLAWSTTSPTINSGFCTSPSISSSNGTAAFTITIGSACAASTGVLTMPTANAGWSCNFRNVTAPASNTPSQTASTTTSVSVTNYARTTGLASNWTASDIIVSDCVAY